MPSGGEKERCVKLLRRSNLHLSSPIDTLPRRIEEKERKANIHIRKIRTTNVDTNKEAESKHRNKHTTTKLRKKYSEVCAAHWRITV